jgi:leader peptidase (prepilin peptidase)/N-methyltransferase
MNNTIQFKLAFSVFLFIIGVIFGSFASCISYRFFNNKISFFSKTRSICRYCNKNIPVFGLIPVISYMFLLRGRCYFCKTRISITYLLSEIFLGFVFLVSYLRYDISFIFITCCILFFLITIQCLIDVRIMMASDFLSLVMLFLSVLIGYFIGIDYLLMLRRFVYTFLFFLTLIFLFSFFFKKESIMGFGDLKILPSLAILLSFEQFIIFIGLMGLFGIISSFFLANEKKEFPFLPSIAGAFFIAFYFISFTMDSLL